MDAHSDPRVITRVVIGYRIGFLASEWLRAWRRLERVLVAANFNVTATLAPLEQLPEDTGILIVAPELREAAHQAAVPGTPILVMPVAAAEGAFRDLVARLEAGSGVTAEKIDSPRIGSYTA